MKKYTMISRKHMGILLAEKDDVGERKNYVMSAFEDTTT